MNIHFFEMINKLIEEFHKSVTFRALKYNISKDKAEVELLEELTSKSIAVAHAIAAVKMMKTNQENEKEEKFKIILQEMESYTLNAAQTTQNRNLQHIIQRMNEENNSLLQMMVGFRECFEKIGNFSDGNTSVQEIRNFPEDMCNLLWSFLSIFNQTKETEEDQQITEIELD